MISDQQIEDSLREILNKDSIHVLTYRKLIEHLETKYKVPNGSFDEKRAFIKSLSKAIVEEVGQQGQPEAGSQPQADGRQEQPQAEPPAEAARQPAEDDAPPSSDTESDVSTEPPKKKRNTGAKAQQQKLMTKATFTEKAPELQFELNGGLLKAVLKPRKFSTGSCGWYYGSKLQIPVDGKEVVCQVGVNCTVVGSKAWEDGELAD